MLVENSLIINHPEYEVTTKNKKAHICNKENKTDQFIQNLRKLLEDNLENTETKIVEI